MSVYFVLCTETSAVKIGYADDPFRRFSKIQSDAPGDLELLAIEGGDKDREAELHAQFAEFRKRGEWFQYSAAIREHVESLPAIGVRNFRKKLGGRLGEWLYGHNLNIRDFAKDVGCCWSSISNFCRGERIPSYDLMRRIYVATNGIVQPNDFYDLPALGEQSKAA